MNPQALLPLSESLALNYPLKTERDFWNIWQHFDRGMRWILLDMLKRYDAHVAKTPESEDPGWTQTSFGPASGLPYCGQIQIRYKKESGRKDERHIDIQFLPQMARTPPWDLAGKIIQEERRTWRKVGELAEAPFFAIESSSKPGQSHVTDPIAEAIMKRFPEPLRNEIGQAICRHALDFNVTGMRGGNARKDEIYFGVARQTKKNMTELIPIGRLSDTIYFQNSWLMIKLAGLPKSVGMSFEKGKKIEDIFDVTINDGNGGILRPFEEMVISKMRRGTTWMGPHVQLKFEKEPADDLRS